MKHLILTAMFISLIGCNSSTDKQNKVSSDSTKENYHSMMVDRMGDMMREMMDDVRLFDDEKYVFINDE